MGFSKRKNQAANKDAVMRMSFLYQAAHLMTDQSKSESGLAKYYLESMKQVSHRTQTRLDPAVKRSFCKNCMSLLRPGINADLKYAVKSKRLQETLLCKSCRRSKDILETSKPLFAYRTEP